uniref:Zinc finger double-stranded RNA binding domain-containing protein n=1 Tax=Strigamia maritima TaxID=126957 RepID=T1IMA4_STRMM
MLISSVFMTRPKWLIMSTNLGRTCLSKLLNRHLFKRYYSGKMKPQIVCVLGSTGTGKSKLGIEIAQAIDGEIISADAMQVYNALDIATNKVTFEEQNAVPHHMLGVAEPSQQFTVVDFRNKVLPIVEDLLSRNKSVVIVGGTYYYVESILWKTLVSEMVENSILNIDEADSPLLFDKDPMLKKRIQIDDYMSENVDVDVDVEFNSVYQSDIELISNRSLHENLMRVDPEIAKRFHFNERRKVIRALQVYEKTGNKLSDLMKLQHSKEGACSISGPLRFENVKILWLQCDTDVLDKRLDGRVDDMIQKGLIDELMDFHQRYKQLLPYTSGVYQSIGLKEFHEFLQLDQIDIPEARNLLEIGIENLRVVTRQYSRKQIRFIQNRFLRQSQRQVPPIYALDTTDVSLWDEKVLLPALKIVNADSDAIQPLDRLKDLHQIMDTFHCPECDVTVIGDHAWQKHTTSRRHKKHLIGLKKHEKILQFKK